MTHSRRGVALREGARFLRGLERDHMRRYVPCMSRSLVVSDLTRAHQLRVILRGISLLIWRHILVRGDSEETYALRDIVVRSLERLKRLIEHGYVPRTRAKRQTIARRRCSAPASSLRRHPIKWRAGVSAGVHAGRMGCRSPSHARMIRQRRILPGPTRTACQW